MDFGTFGAELASNPLAQLAAAVLSLAGGYKMWRQSSSGDTKERANNDGQIAALAVWKELVEIERASRIRAEERADEAAERAEAFSEERNQAVAAVWEMRGQLKAMNETITKQNEELMQLRNKICELEEKIDGNKH